MGYMIAALVIGVLILMGIIGEQQEKGKVPVYRDPVKMPGPIPIKKRARRGSVEWFKEQTELSRDYKQFKEKEDKALGRVLPRPKGASKLEWFITDWGKKSIPSPAEQLIIDELGKYDIRWEREVSFIKLPTANKGHYRFDIYLIDHSTILEYDGEIWHKDTEAKGHDKIKDKFCKDNNLQMIRYNKQDYYKLQFRIEELMDNLKIKRI